jgi:2-dehydro-3-deoxyglucarate aldolase
MDGTNSFNELPGSDRVLVGSPVDSPKQVEVMGKLGADYAFLELEHAGFSPWNSPKLESYAARAELVGIDLLVRLPSGTADAHGPLIRKVLDTGIRNVLVPRVETADQVRAAVKASQFHYDGDSGARGLGGGRSAGYGLDIDSEYPTREDREVCVGIMVENTTCLDNLADILSVPELGFGFVGHGDLSHSLGHPMEIDHPDVQEAVAKIEDVFRNSAVPLGTMYFDADELQEFEDRGYQLLTGTGPLRAAMQQFSSLLDAVDEQIDGDAGSR